MLRKLCCPQRRSLETTNPAIRPNGIGHAIVRAKVPKRRLCELIQYFSKSMNESSGLPPDKKLSFAGYLLAAIAFLGNSVGVFVANRDQPALFGFPFLICYLILWTCATPIFLWLADRSTRQ
jgi:hypothetical protein